MLTPSRALGVAWDCAKRVWDAEFNELPWIHQPLKLRLKPCVAPVVRVLLGGLESVPTGHWEGVDGSCFPAQAEIDHDGWIVWTVQSGGADAVVPVALVLSQQAGTQEPGQCVAAQQDPSTLEWTVIYNTLDRVRELQKAWWSAFEAEGLRTRSGLLPLLDSLVESRQSQASAILDADAELKASPDLVRAVLSRFQLDWNGHGVKRTFGYWSVQRKRAYLMESIQVVHHLEATSDGVCLGFGGVLGWKRNQDLIAHDDDLDVLVAFDRRRMPDLARALRFVECELRERGCIIKGRFFAHLWVQLSEDSPQTLDVFVGLIEGEEVSFYPSRRGGLKTSSVFPAAQQELLGLSVPMPANPDAYLAGTYGPDWQTPRKGFAHPWSRQEYADIAGHRTTPAMWTRGELAQRASA